MDARVIFAPSPEQLQDRLQHTLRGVRLDEACVVLSEGKSQNQMVPGLVAVVMLSDSVAYRRRLPTAAQDRALRERLAAAKKE